MLPLLALLCLSSAFTAAAFGETHNQLLELAKEGNGVIQLNAVSFDLLTTPERNWSASIAFTALDPQWECGACRDLHPRWKLIGRAWWDKVPKTQRDRHFFAAIDFDDENQKVFRKLALDTAPMVLFFPPTEGPNATSEAGPTKFDLSSYDSFDTKLLANHLSEYTPVPIPYVVPIDWARWIANGFAFVASAVVLRLLVPLLLNRWAWAVSVILTSLIMTSGFMFTRIRDSPHLGRDGAWVARGTRDMFVREVPMVAFAYGVLGFAFFMLITAVPSQSSAQRQRLHVYIWSGVIMVGYSMLIVLYKVKNRYYPFRLLL